MNFISIRLCEHDSNISFFDGEEIHYLKSERIFDTKHHAYNNLIEWRQTVFDHWNIDINDVKEMSVVLDPWIYNFPLDKKIFFPSTKFYCHELGNVTRVNHHWAHALSNNLVHGDMKNHMIIDGFGDKDVATTVFKNNKLVQTTSFSKHGSIGTYYGDVALDLGIKVSHECDLAGKLMGLQSYGSLDKGFYNTIKNFDITKVKQIYNFNLYIDYKKDPLIAFHNKLNWAHTIHKRLGEVILEYFKKHFKKKDTIGYAGGVAHNIIWNTLLKEEYPNLNIPPHCDDEGLSLGGVKFLLDKYKIKKYKLNNFPFCQTDESTEEPSIDTVKKIAKYLAKGEIVAWYQGHGEIGARALGHRSILMNPYVKDAKEKLNKIKNREVYRPFGASVLEEDYSKYTKARYLNPYMLYVNYLIKDLDSVQHVDKTCRLQSVSKDNKYFYALLQEYKKITGESLIINTSLNISGKPIMNNIKSLLEFKNKNNIKAVYGNTIIR